MSKITNEKEFDKRLVRIGELYEEGKDIVSETVDIVAYEKHFWRLHAILQELRDIAATSLKANHEIGDN